MMRIVMANNYYYLRGGAERVLFEEKQLLQKNDHHVIVFSQAHLSNEHSEYANYFAPFVDWRSSGLVNKIPTAINIIYNCRSRRAFLRLVEDAKPEIVHAHNIYGGLTTSILDASEKKGVPVIITLHDYKLICPAYLMLNRGNICEDCKGRKFIYCLINRCHKENLAASLVYCVESYFNKWLRKYDRIRYLICPSLFSLRKHADSGMPEEKLVHIRNFVNITDYKPNYQKGDYVLFVGRLSKEKGVLTLLEAVKRLRIPIRIVGDGPLKDKYEAYIKDKGMAHVIFDGYRSGVELRSLFQNSAFLVFPSECYENAPMTILEAFAYGKPVIGSRIGGIPEMIEPNKTGLLFTPGDADELHQCINALWTKSSLVLDMGRAARRKVEEEFSPDAHYEKLMETYRNAMG